MWLLATNGTEMDRRFQVPIHPVLGQFNPEPMQFNQHLQVDVPV
jgi:hypothetical protein